MRAAAKAQHRTQVPFKSVLMHVCVLDASDGVVDGAVGEFVDKMSKNAFMGDKSGMPDGALPPKTNWSTGNV